MITGKAREHEVRLMGFGLAALVLLAAAAVLWLAAAAGDQLRAPVESDAAVMQVSHG